MKYSVFTVMTPSWAPEELAGRLAAAGYNGIEWRVEKALKATPDPIPPRDLWYWNYNKATLDVDEIETEAPRAAVICKKSGLEMLSLASYLTPGEFEKIERVMKAARDTGARMIRLFPYRYHDGDNYVELFNKARREMHTVCEMAKQYGVEANLEIHMDTIIPSASAAYRLVEGLNSDYVGFVYDAGNMTREGYEQYSLGMQLLDRYIHHVHIKDGGVFRTEKDGRPVFTPEWTVIGQGAVNFEKQRDALRLIGYDRYLSFEDFTCVQSDEDKLAHNIAYIRSVFEA